MKKEKTRLLVKVIVLGLGAITWSADCAGAMSHGHTGLGWLLLIAAVVFFVVFDVTLRQYLGSRKEEQHKRGAVRYDF